MRFTKAFVTEFRDTLVRLGITACPLCRTDGMLNVHHLPAILEIGGVYRELETGPRDPEGNILYMLRVECEMCGHTALVDSEKHQRNRRILITLSVEEEDRMTAEGHAWE